MALPRPLDPVEIRVLGCLLEKQQTTPEYYPLTLNALIAACNQKSNREPVMELVEPDVRHALERLRAEALVLPVEGSRVERWEHRLDRRLDLSDSSRAILTVLYLRGPQTPGELRTRCERMYPFATPSAVEDELTRLATGVEPLVADLGRAPGQKEHRWTHTAAGEVQPQPVRVATIAGHAESLADRVAHLEGEVARLTAELSRLLAVLGEKS
jgi:uncharacterized protein